MMMLVLCCVGTFAQEATEYAGWMISAGTAQDTMVSNTWYFVRTPRNPNTAADQEEYFLTPGGELLDARGGFVYDNGSSAAAGISPSSVIDEMTSGNGISANSNMAMLLRFVPVAGKDGAYYIQFGTGRWMGTDLTSVTDAQKEKGLAGEFNFYLVDNNDMGRFAWNKYDMAGRIDNNGAGNTISFWGSGKVTGELVGNKIWQIFDVVTVMEEDTYQTTLDQMMDVWTVIYDLEEGYFTDNLREGENVGTSYGNYRQEDVDAFLTLWDEFDAVVNSDPETLKEDYTEDELIQLLENMEAAYEALLENKIPLKVAGIAPGYYTINSMLAFTQSKNDTVYYTQEECDSINAGVEPSDSTYKTIDDIKTITPVTVPAPTKAWYSKANGAVSKPSWGSLEAKPEFLWKLEAVEGRPYEYRLINMLKGETFNDFSNMQENDTVTFMFDYKGKGLTPATSDRAEQDSVVYYAIRNPYSSTEGGQKYIHANQHGSGSGTGSNLVGWFADGGASYWYLNPIDETTANLWMESDEAKYRAMVAEANAILATVPGQLNIAKDIVVTVHEDDSVVLDASQFYGNATIVDGNNGLSAPPASADDTYALIIDGNPTTFWHSDWSGGNVAEHVHYLQINADEALEGLFSIKLARRAGAANDHPTRLAVVGYDEDDAELGYEDGTLLGVLTFPYSGAGEWDTANELFDASGKSVFRFYWEQSNGGQQRGYWHTGEFNMYAATQSTYHATTQYAARAEQVAALEAAIAAWEAGEYTEETTEQYSEEAFQNAYANLIAAAKAWEAVYVDPAALRAAVEAAPDANLFVTGTNPGQWPEGATTPVAAVAAAKAYDETGLFTPAESEAMIKAIEEATEQAFTSANKIETGVWYRISFPTEEMYETYGWDTTGADERMNENAGAPIGFSIFGKTLAAGKSFQEYFAYNYTNDEGEEEEDTMTTYSVKPVEEIHDGNGLYFFDATDGADYEEDHDLFRFVQATDSSYFMQHKASGLFVNASGYGSAAVTLSSTPVYYQVEAIGAGANIISMTNLFGQKPTNHVNLHVQRDDNKLVCWESSQLGTNSMLLIEAVEAVAEEPSTDYTKQLWPGSVYMYTNPVDVSIASGATAYSAELVIAEDTTVVLKAIEAEVIKAGTPYVMIADLEDEFVSYDDRWDAIFATLEDDEDMLRQEKVRETYAMIAEEYAVVEMWHGMEVDTTIQGMGDLVGTLHGETVAAGKGIIADNNGFKLLVEAHTVGAGSAYVGCDFDGTSSDILSSVKMKIEGSVDTGINEVLGTVAKAGNIYTIDGKLVGKGNINTIKRLPAGIYVINGVKVTKN